MAFALAVLDVVLRVPLLFRMEEITKRGLDKITNSAFTIFPDNSTEVLEKVTIIVEWNQLVKHFSLLEGCIILLTILTMHRKFLLAIYLWAFSLGSLMLMHAWNDIYINYCLDLVAANSCITIQLLALNEKALKYFFASLLIQATSALMFSSSIKWLYGNSTDSFLSWIFMSATPLSLLLTCPEVLSLIPRCVTLFLLGFMFLKMTTEDSFDVRILQDKDDEIITTNIHLKESLSAYWLLRAARQSSNLLLNQFSPLDFFNQILANGCDSYMATTGMASVISFLSTYFLDILYAFLFVEYSEPIRVGDVSAILFFVLSLQKQLPFLNQKERLAKLHMNLFLVLNLVLHFVHLSVKLAFVRLSLNSTLNKHVRFLIMCFSLLVVTCLLSAHLWQIYPEESWTVVVLFFNGELILNILVTLDIYFLFLADGYEDDYYWESLDDRIYWVTFFGHVTKFLVSVAALIFALKNLSCNFTEVFTICTLFLHVYVNIWYQALIIFRILKLRISAQRKISTMKDADQEQLKSLKDICPICYHAMKNAKITKCKHYFHGCCLKKWLYVQDTCPLCSTKLFRKA